MRHGYAVPWFLKPAAGDSGGFRIIDEQSENREQRIYI